MRRKILLGCLLVFCGISMYGGETVDLSDQTARDGVGYTVQNESGSPILTINADGDYVIKQTKADEAVNFQILISDAVKNVGLTFNDINITNMQPFVSRGENTVINLTLVGENFIYGSFDAINVSGTMNIGGDGILNLSGQAISLNTEKTHVTINSGTVTISCDANCVWCFSAGAKFTINGGEVIMYSKYSNVLGLNIITSLTMMEWKYAAANATEETVIDMKKGNEIVRTFHIPAGYKYFACAVEPTQIYTLWKNEIQMKNGTDVKEFSAPEGSYVKYDALNAAVPPTETMELTAGEILEYAPGVFNGITKSITMKGEWDANAITALKNAIHINKDGKNVNETLEKVNMSEITTTSSINFGSLFENCSMLESVILPELEVTTETGMSKIFAGCSKLTTVSNLEKMVCTYNWSGAFEGCELLESVIFASENKTTRSTLLSNIFKGCKKLSIVENFNSFTKIDALNNGFEGCESLKEITFAEISESGATLPMRNVFKDCKKIETITNFERFNKVGSYVSAFENCEQLTYIALSSIPEDDPDGGKYENTFKNCNPNCLKYLTTDSVAAVKEWSNIIINKIMPQSTFILNENHAFAVLEDFDAQSVLYNRECLIDGNWQTICLPFDVLMITNGSEAMDNYRLKVYKGYQTEDQIAKVYFEDYKGDGAALMKANIPYLIAFTPTSDVKPGTTATLTFLNYGLTKFTKDFVSSEENTDCNYKGTYSFLKDRKENIYYFDEQNQKFVKDNGEANMTPFRAYCEVSPSITASEILLSFSPPVNVPDIISEQTDFKISTIEGAIIISSSKSRQINIFAIDGKLIKSIKLEQGKNIIRGLKEGIYLLENQKIVIMN